MNRSRKELFDCRDFIDLEKSISIPKEIGNDVYKCKIIYSKGIKSVEFITYKKRNIRKIKLVKSDTIDYKYKFVNRNEFERMLKTSNAEEILIIKNDFVTDTSFSNVALYDGSEWFTPSTPLLKGTKRQMLIDNKRIIERSIISKELKNYQKLSLINAMLDLGELVIDMENIID